MKKIPQIVIWATALLLSGRMVWLAVQHDMPAFDTLTIGIFALYGVHAGATNVHQAITRARQSGSTR